MPAIGGVIAFIVLCLLIYHAIDVGFAAYGHWLWIVPVVVIAGAIAFLFKGPGKGIYK